MKRMISRRILVGMAVAGLNMVAGPAMANNVVVTNTDLQAPGAGKVTVRFDLAWDNSWRDGTNYDACWVFVKYSTDGGTNWSHATLATSGTNPAGFSGGSGTSLDIVVPADKAGAFIQRSVVGAGTVANTGVQLVWDFATNGVGKCGSARVKVFAVEMVYVKEGAFKVGSGGSETSPFYEYPTPANPYTISNEAAIAVGTNAGNLAYAGSGSNTIPAAFPKGYAAFYLMKMEISQRQYCDFLNTLTATQQDNRHDSALHFNSYRNFIKKTSGSPAFFGCDANNNAGAATSANAALLNETNDGEWVACVYISWMDGAAFADWAALRPFTELEFEKACRGPLAAVSNEYAWGDATLEAPVTSVLNNQYTASEAPNQGNCNSAGCQPLGPYRVGSYADASSSRVNAGAGYYGALDLSGNLWEKTVTVAHSTGRGFTGMHGDGILSVIGNANVGLWPGFIDGVEEVTGATGAGFRGGSWFHAGANSQVSDRFAAANPETSRNQRDIGWRGARSAP